MSFFFAFNITFDRPLIDLRRRIKTSSACIRCPAGNLKLGEAGSARLIGRELLRGIYRRGSNRPLPSSARRPSHCSSQGGRFVWNDILGIRRIAEEQEMCSWAAQHTLEWEVQGKSGRRETSVLYRSSSLVQMNLSSYRTSAELPELHLSRLSPGLFPCNMFCTAAVMEVFVRACSWQCGWMTKWDQFFIYFVIFCISLSQPPERQKSTVELKKRGQQGFRMFWNHM